MSTYLPSRRLATPWGTVLLVAALYVGSSVKAQEHEAEVIEPPGVGAAVEEPATSDRQARFREVLSLAGWDESRFSKFADGEPMTIDEQLEVWRFVERLTTLSPAWMHRRHGLVVSARELLDSPETFRGQLVRLRGRARKVEVEQPNPDDRREFSIAEFYRTTIDVDGTLVVVTTPRVPERWDQLNPLDEPVEVAGVFVKLAADPTGGLIPQIAATEIAWFPAKVDPPAISYGMTILGILEVDVGQLDRLVQRSPLTRDDAPAFYHILEGMGASQVPQLQGAADRQLRQAVPRWEERLAEAVRAGDKDRELLARTVIKEAKEGNYSVAPFFNTPREQVGQIASFNGTVRSALRVGIESQVAARHNGLDHYYQLALFTSDSQNYPIYFCVRELPEGFPLGDDVEVPVRVAGFFLKMWQYRSRVEGAGTQGNIHSDETLKAIQAPLFIGVAPQIISRPTSDRTWGYVVAGGVVTMLAGVWLVEWARLRRDRQYAATTLARVQRSAVELDFDRLASEGPHEVRQAEATDAEHPFDTSQADQKFGRDS